MSAVTFEVIGDPAAQGSKRSVGNNVFVETSKKLPAWRDSVATAARNVAVDAAPLGFTPLTGPLALTVHFRHPMPKSRKAAVRNAGRGPKVSAPDLDKLVRAVGDALKAGGLIADDALFCEITATKAEVIGWTGCEITVSDDLNWFEATS